MVCVMARRAASFTQADIARTIRAAKQEGGVREIEVRVGEKATIIIKLGLPSTEGDSALEKNEEIVLLMAICPDHGPLISSVKSHDMASLSGMSGSIGAGAFGCVLPLAPLNSMRNTTPPWPISPGESRDHLPLERWHGSLSVIGRLRTGRR